MGIDVGTSGCKAVAFNEDGEVLAIGYQEYFLLHRKPGWSELDASVVLEKIKKVIKDVVENTRNDPVEAFAVSCQGEAVMPINKHGELLYNAVVTFDSRTQEQHEWWLKNHDPRKIFNITGMPLNPMYSLNKIMWFKKHEPDIYNEAWKFPCFEDFVLFSLCQDAAIDYSLAARTMAFDVINKCWSEEMINAADISPDVFFPVIPSGQVVGRIRPEVARELGLNKSVVGVTGGHDQPCGALGAGIISEGFAMNATGTSDVITPAFRKPILSDAMLKNNFPCYPHVVPDMYITITFNLTGGLLLKWYRDTFAYEEKEIANREGRDIYDVIIERVDKKPVDVFILPHFVGSGTPYLDSKSRGIVVGLTLETNKNTIAKAVLDSNCYDLRLNLERLAQVGVQVNRIRVIGGGAKSEYWMRLKSEILGLPVESLHTNEAASLGDAILAGVAIGRYADCSEGVRRSVKVKQEIVPNFENKKEFDERFEIYKTIYDSNRTINHKIFELGRTK